MGLNRVDEGLFMGQIKYLACMLLLGLSFFSNSSTAYSEQPLHGMIGEEGRTYMLNISGTVLNKSFHNSMAVMTIVNSDEGNINPYVIKIYGFPQTNERNVFTWDSEDSYMTSFPGTITCVVKYSYMNEPLNIHFLYASPVLYERTLEGVVGQLEEEESARLAEIVLEPTKVIAQAGKLELTISGNRVSGKVWIKGYDQIENSYVNYSASLSGRTVRGIDPRLPRSEPHPMHILEDTDPKYSR